VDGTVETPRLVLRPFAPDDWRAVHAYAADPAVMRYIPGRALSEEQAKTFAAESGGDDAHVAAVLKAEGRPIGHLPFQPWYSPHRYAIGWVVHPRHQGRGSATEAATAQLRHGFEALGLHRIVATGQPENPASWRAMEKLGMQRVAHVRQGVRLVAGGAWLDEDLHAILAEEWFGGRGAAGGAGPVGSG